MELGWVGRGRRLASWCLLSSLVPSGRTTVFFLYTRLFFFFLALLRFGLGFWFGGCRFFCPFLMCSLVRFFGLSFLLPANGLGTGQCICISNV